jgi:hypothetical protein
MDFWQNHSWLFLIGATIFPRLTMLFAVAVPFGWLHWLGWLFAPHLTVAILATMYYWDTEGKAARVASRRKRRQLRD